MMPQAPANGCINMSKKFKEQEKRIEQVFNNTFNDISRRLETLEHYNSFLEEKLNFPVRLTGIEDFSWEEFYLLGPGDKGEYEKLTQTQPSYTNVFSMSKISSHCDKHYGWFAKATRLADNKRFELPLADLKAVEKKSDDYLLLHDYSVWVINY
jgi:hypothetical protein